MYFTSCKVLYISKELFSLLEFIFEPKVLTMGGGGGNRVNKHLSQTGSLVECINGWKIHPPWYQKLHIYYSCVFPHCACIVPGMISAWHDTYWMMNRCLVNCHLLSSPCVRICMLPEHRNLGIQGLHSPALFITALSFMRNINKLSKESCSPD